MNKAETTFGIPTILVDYVKQRARSSKLTYYVFQPGGGPWYIVRDRELVPGDVVAVNAGGAILLRRGTDV